MPASHDVVVFLFWFSGQDMAVTEIFAKACKIEVPTTGLVSDPADDDDVPGNPVGVSLPAMILLQIALRRIGLFS